MAELISSSSERTEDLGQREAARTEVANVDASEAYERGKVDINFFMMLCLPHIATSALPLFYIACWQLVCLRNVNDVGKLLRFALGLPRGHAKTTFIKVLICWLICYEKATFVLIVCAAEDLAHAVLADISDILGSPNIEAIYGRWTDNLSTDNVREKICSRASRTIILKAKGAESSVRGINVDNLRPDVIFCDDVQTKENDESDVLRKALLTWLVGTLFKTISYSGNRLIIYAGNMYSDECILYKFKESRFWISLVTGAILETGEPLWPDLHSLEDLVESYEHDDQLGEGDSWFAEVMNDPKSAATSLLPHPIPSCPFPPHALDYQGAYVTIDPAGFRNMSDDNVIVGHKVFGNKAVISDIDAGNFNPQEVVTKALTMAMDLGATVIGVESVGYQQSLGYWIKFFMQEMGIKGIEVVELSPHGRHKEARIRQFISELYLEDYYLEDGLARTLFTWQAHAFKIGRKNNKDDILDACAYGTDMRRDYWHYISLNSRQADKLPTVVYDNTPF